MGEGLGEGPSNFRLDSDGSCNLNWWRLTGCGFRVLRFWNDRMLSDIDVVVGEIVGNLKVPHPHPLPS
ncbi:MAG: DUF559 domain-containing protein [Candidatus Binatales bacterium]